MGGKRPDQYQIDPREAGATDYKNLPETSQGNSALDDTVRLDRQRLAESEAMLEEDIGGRVPAPGSRPKPSALPDYARREPRTEHRHEAGHTAEHEAGRVRTDAADSDPSKEDPLA
jgi:hypothetical protein